MGNVFRNWVARSNAGDTDVRSFAGLAQGVVARVEVFAFLEIINKDIRIKVAMISAMWRKSLWLIKPRRALR